MQSIPLPKQVFESLYTAYDLRCYCGEQDNRCFGEQYLPGRMTDVAAGETVRLFAPGRNSSFREIIAEIIKTDPIEIRVISAKPSPGENHPRHYSRQNEAAAQCL